MERTCGTCHWCERFDDERGVIYDPWSEVEEPLRTELRGRLGICGQEGEPPCGVELVSPCGLCGDEGYERRHA